MKVLESAPKWTHKQKCKGCGALLLVEKDDLRVAQTYNAYNKQYDCAAFDCCECDKENHISGSVVLPRSIKRRMRR